MLAFIGEDKRLQRLLEDIYKVFRITPLDLTKDHVPI